nr:MAG TPA: hypothetical protein [Caudoviricetes sp.]
MQDGVMRRVTALWGLTRHDSFTSPLRGYSCIRSGLKIWGLTYRSVATIV